MHAVVGLGTYFVHVGSPGCIIDAVTMVSRKIVKKGVKHFKKCSAGEIPAPRAPNSCPVHGVC